MCEIRPGHSFAVGKKQGRLYPLRGKCRADTPVGTQPCVSPAEHERYPIGPVASSKCVQLFVCAFGTMALSQRSGDLRRTS